MNLVFTHECDNCGVEMKHQTYILDVENETIKYPVSFVSQMDFICLKCGLEHGIGEVDVINHHELGLIEELPEIPTSEETE